MSDPQLLGERVAAVAAALDPPMVFGDVGARWGPGDRWRDLAPPVQIVAFEPDEAECRRLAARQSAAVRFEPVALGARPGPATLHVTRDPACSSLYPPDERAIAAHPELAVAAPASERTVQLQTLDDWCALDHVAFDALKLDVQGAELDVLRGAERQLQRVVMLETEVQFNPIYRGLPLFADVDRFLRERGFVLWRLGNLAHYGRRGLDSTLPIADVCAFDSRVVPISGQGGQLFWGNAHYLAADVLADGERDRMLRAAVAADAFGFADLSMMLLGAAQVTAGARVVAEGS